MLAHLEEIAGATGDIEGTAALIIHQEEEFQIYPEKVYFIHQADLSRENIFYNSGVSLIWET